MNLSPFRSERVTVGGWVYELLVPADSDGLLDDPRVVERFELDEYLPYWATIWPAALGLAEYLAGRRGGGESDNDLSTLELGCGLGLVSLVAAGLGWRVIATDYDEDALAFARENARRAGVVIETQVVDWRRSYPELRVDRILGADVLYEARNLEPVAQFVCDHLVDDGLALLSDPCRSVADGFVDAAVACGLAVEVENLPVGGDGQGARIRVFRVRLAG